MNRPRALSSAFVIYTLPALTVFSAILLTLGFTVLILSTLVGFHLGGSLLHPNPFADYEALWPGQPATNIVPFARFTAEDRVTCLSSSLSQTSFATAMAGRDLFCSFTIQEGLFRMLSISVHDGEIQELRFFSDKLSQDDLFLYWGVPDQIRTSSDRLQFELDWDRLTYYATAFVEMADATVQSVTLAAKE